MARFGKHRTKASADIPLVSMSDIAFLLIIFFLVTTQLERLKTQNLELPSTKESEQKDIKVKNLQVNLKENLAMVGDQARYALPKDLAKLVDHVAREVKKAKTKEEKVIIVQADGTVRWELWVNVVEAIKDVGGIPAVQTEEVVSVRK